MKATAEPGRSTGKIHTLSDGSKNPTFTSKRDGSVEVAFQATEFVSLTSKFPSFKITFSKAEIDDLHRESFAGSVQARINGPDPQPKPVVVTRRF